MSRSSSNPNLLPPMARIYDVIQQNSRRVPHQGFNRYSPSLHRSSSNSRSSRSYRPSISRSECSISFVLRPTLPLACHPGDAPVVGPAAAPMKMRPRLAIPVYKGDGILSDTSPSSFKSPMVDYVSEISTIDSVLTL